VEGVKFENDGKVLEKSKQPQFFPTFSEAAISRELTYLGVKAIWQR
jgi:hypothetical protein